MEDMKDSLRDEISLILETRRTLAALGRVSMSPATEREIVEHFEDLFGYAIEVCGIKNLAGLDPLLTEPFFTRFAFWLRKERKCKRSTIVGRLSRMFSALETAPGFEGRDFSWIYNVYRKLRKEPESALKERRRQRHIEFLELAAIPGRMREERMTIQDQSPESLAWWIQRLDKFGIVEQRNAIRGHGRNRTCGPPTQTEEQRTEERMIEKERGPGLLDPDRGTKVLRHGVAASI
jgi:hypothetical protein